MQRAPLIGLLLLSTVACGGEPAAPTPPASPPPEPAPLPVDPAITPPRALAIGMEFVCVLRDRRVLCAGEAPGHTSLAALTPLPWLDNVVEIDADDHNLCALGADGTVRCARWQEPPSDVAGVDDAVRIRVADSLLVQRRDGSLVHVSPTAGQAPRPIPAEVAGTERSSFDATADLHAANDRACALGAHGSVACARDGDPVAHVYVERGARAITIANSDLLVLGQDGTVARDMINDQLYELVPAGLPDGLTTLRSRCGLRDGTAVCWSFDGTPDEHQVAGRAFVEVAHTHSFACAIDAQREVYCWGAPPPGVTGRPGHEPRGPNEVAGLRDATAVSVADDHACALRSGGAVWCWGRGFGSVPREVPLGPLGPAVELVSTQHASCVRDAAGRVVCWGRRIDHFRQSSVTVEPHPIEIADAVQLAAAGDQVCARTRSGAVSCWVPTQSTESWPQATLTGASAIGGGRSFVCGVVDGSLRCVSTSVDVLTPSSVPVAEVELGALDALAVGGEAACWRRDGTWRCLGHNGVGQLGRAASRPLTTPVAFPAGVDALVSGLRRTCGIGRGGSVRCAGVLPDGSPRDPDSGRGRGQLVTLAGLEGVRAVALGTTLACALLEDGRVRCWGDGYEGGLGDGTSALLDAATRIPVGGL